MCGILGYRSDAPTTEHLELLRRLAFESSVRGLHAFGWGWSWSRESPAIQTFLHRDEWIAHLDRLFAGHPPTRLIGHCRYSTSGDWQSPTNNQPLYQDGVALAFNGTIDMGTKAEMECRHHTSLATENDGELALQQLREGGAAQLLRWLPALATFAGVWLDQQGLWALRNEQRPLWQATRHDRSAVVLASTQDILTRAGVTEAQWRVLALSPLVVSSS